MPYLKFRTTTNANVELKGDTTEQFRAAIEKHGSIDRPDLALAFVEAYFKRRSHQVLRQKAEQIGDEDTADKEYDLTVEAEEIEEEAKAAYEKSRGQAAPEAAAPVATSSSATSSNPYGDIMGTANNDNPVDDDDFM